jgi:hypothetical protein
LKELNICKLADSFGLIHLPKMPELRDLDTSEFIPLDIDINEIKLKDTKNERLLYLFETDEDYKNMNTYLWFKTTYSTFSNIINSSIQDLLNILEKYKKYDYLFVMNDNEV